MRVFWYTTAVLLLGFSVAGAVERPNVLLIVSEDNGPELGCYGDPFASTPHLDLDLRYRKQQGFRWSYLETFPKWRNAEGSRR